MIGAETETVRGIDRINALPPERRRRAMRLLLEKMVARFDENRHISEKVMRHALGFNRADLVTWYAQARNEVKRG